MSKLTAPPLANDSNFRLTGFHPKSIPLTMVPLIAPLLPEHGRLIRESITSPASSFKLQSGTSQLPSSTFRPLPAKVLVQTPPLCSCTAEPRCWRHISLRAAKTTQIIYFFLKDVWSAQTGSAALDSVGRGEAFCFDRSEMGIKG